MLFLTSDAHGVCRSKPRTQGTNTFHCSNANTLTMAGVPNGAPLQRASLLNWHPSIPLLEPFLVAWQRAKDELLPCWLKQVRMLEQCHLPAWETRQESGWQEGGKNAPLSSSLRDVFGWGCLFTAPTIFPPPANCWLPSDGKINQNCVHRLYCLLWQQNICIAVLLSPSGSLKLRIQILHIKKDMMESTFHSVAFIDVEGEETCLEQPWSLKWVCWLQDTAWWDTLPCIWHTLEELGFEKDHSDFSNPHTSSSQGTIDIATVEYFLSTRLVILSKNIIKLASQMHYKPQLSAIYHLILL